MKYLFDFGSLSPEKDAVKVQPHHLYSDHFRYGFVSHNPIITRENPSGDGFEKDYCQSEGSFLFKVDLPEGNYRIMIYPGPESRKAGLTIKAESRRLISYKWSPADKEETRLCFTINVRSSRLKSGEEIPFTINEEEALNWNKSLNLEFLGETPSISAIKIETEPEAKTLFLAGDSTVTDQEKEPWSAWGQMLPSFFKEGLAVANHAKSGGSLKSFQKEHRMEKIFEQMCSGDYLFFQFAHNDQKPGEFHSSPWKDYKKLLKKACLTALDGGVHPVIVSPVQRRRFNKSGNFYLTLEDYPAAARKTAEEMNIPFLDLSTISQKFFEELGEEISKKAFLHLPAGSYPGQPEKLEDDTHFSTWGAYQLARLLIQEIEQKIPKLALFLRKEENEIPNDPELWNLSKSPVYTMLIEQQQDEQKGE